MATKKKKKPTKKRSRKNSSRKKSLVSILRHWFLPLLLLFLLGFSIAATFYIVFLHTPAKPIF